MEHDFVAKGFVTYINESLLYFTIIQKDQKPFTIFTGMLYFKDQKAVLPQLGQNIKIKKCHILEPYNDCLFLCQQNSVQPDFTEIKDSILGNIKNDSRLGNLDLLAIKFVHDHFQIAFPELLDDKNEETFCLEVYQKLIDLEQSPNYHVTDQCHNLVVTSYKIGLPLGIRNLIPNIDKTIHSQLFSHGEHPSQNCDILIGHICISSKTGLFTLSDLQYDIVLVFEDNNFNREAIFNSYVVITKYRVLTESYNEFGSAECLYVNINDVHVLRKDLTIKLSDRVYDTLPAGQIFSKKMIFQITAKSTVSYDDSNLEKCFWLSIIILSHPTIKKDTRCYLCLKKDFVRSWCLFKTNTIYELHHLMNLMRISDVDYTKMSRYAQQYTLNENDNAVFVELYQIEDDDLPLLNVETMNDILAKEGLVSCKARIKFKKFSDPYASLKQRNNRCEHFGTQGPKTHVLDLEVLGMGVKTIPLYLNDWEGLLNPYGMLPNAQIEIRNVLVQKRKYFKSCALTTLTLLKL